LTAANNLPVDTPPFPLNTTFKYNSASTPVRNDIIAMKVTIGEDKPAPGMLVVASIVDTASYPVSGWVGHGVADEWVLVDTNNFYNKDTGENLELIGGEAIRLILVGGLKGSVENQDTVPDPEATAGIQALAVAASMPDTGSAGVPTSRDSSGGGGGGGCFIGAADFGSEADFPVLFIPSLLVLFGIALLLSGAYMCNHLLRPPLQIPFRWLR